MIPISRSSTSTPTLEAVPVPQLFRGKPFVRDPNQQQNAAAQNTAPSTQQDNQPPGTTTSSSQPQPSSSSSSSSPSSSSSSSFSSIPSYSSSYAVPPGHPNYNPSHPNAGPNRLQPGQPEQPGAPGQAKIGASFNPFSKLSGDSNFVPANLSDLRHGLSGASGGSAGQDMSLKGLLGVQRAANMAGGQLHASSPLMQASALSYQQSEQLHLLHQQQHMELQKQQQLQKNQLIQQQKMIQKMYYEASHRQLAYNATHSANSTKTSTSTSPSFPTQSNSVIDLSAAESDEDDKRDLALLGAPGSDGLRRTNGFDDESLSKSLHTVPTGGLDGLLSAYAAPLLPSLQPDSTVHSDYYTAVEAVYQNKSGSGMSTYTAAAANTTNSSSSSSSGATSSEAVMKSAQASSSNAPETVAPDSTTPSNNSLTVGPSTEGGSEVGLTDTQMGQSQGSDPLTAAAAAAPTTESIAKAVLAVKEEGSEEAVMAGQGAAQGTLQYWMDSEKAGNSTSSSSSGRGAEGHASESAGQSTAATSSLPTYASLGLVSIPTRVQSASTALEGDVKNHQSSSEIVSGAGTGTGTAGTASDGPSSSSTVTTRPKQAPAVAPTAANKFVTDPVQMAAIRKQMHVQSLKPPVIKSFTPLSSGRKVRCRAVTRILSYLIVAHLLCLNGSPSHVKTILPNL